MKQILLRLFLTIAIITPLNIQAVQIDYGSWGTITVYIDETVTLSEKFSSISSFSMSKVRGWEWSTSSFSSESVGFYSEITSQSNRTCVVKGRWNSKGYSDKIYCKVTYGSSNNINEYIAYYNVIVKSRGTITVSASPSSGTVAKGTKVTITPSVSGSTIYYTTDGSMPTTSSSVYSSSSGVIINKTTTLKARAVKSGYESEISTWNFTVKQPVEKITISPSTISLGINETKQLTATVTPSNAADKSVTWSSSPTGIVTVSSTGQVKGVKEGTTTVTCKANDGSGVSATCEVTVSSPIVAEINSTNFPDASFRSWLLSQSYGADGKLTESEIYSITKIDVSGSSSSPGTIKSLKGIEYFTALKYLYCENNQLTSLDVSKNTALTYLYCQNNQLTSLDVSKSTALKTLSCGDNQLTSLDVSKNTALASLYCHYNQLTSLDVSKNTALTLLSCTRNQLTSLDVSRLTALTDLACGENKLTSLDVSKNTALTLLSCTRNQLTSLDVSRLTALTSLYCYNNTLKGFAMDNLISSLPINNTGEVHRFSVVAQDLANEGNVCTIAQVAAVKAKGWFPCYYDSTTKEYVEYEGSDDTSTIKGDVNGDGQVNGTDLVALTNIILGKSSKTDTADVNGDGYVNGTDYVALVNIVLGRTNAKAMAKGAIQAAVTTGLSIESFDIKAGETKEMVIDLTNPNDEITLVQFDLRLPEGLGWEGDIDIPGRTTWRKHSLDANETNGIIRFLLASTSNATLEGTEGAIITLTITADKNVTGGDIQLENILMVTPAEKEIKQGTYTYHVGQSQPTPASTGLSIESFDIKAGETKEMVIDLKNPDDEITLVQFDLRLPAGLSVKQTGDEYVYDIAGRTTWRKHSLDANATNGIIRFLLASSSNTTLSGTEGAIITMTLKADNSFTGGAVKLENILLVTPEEKEIKQSDVSYTIGTTGIESIAADSIEKDAPIFSLSGQRLDKPRKGINIIGGKKVVVK